MAEKGLHDTDVELRGLAAALIADVMLRRASNAAPTWQWRADEFPRPQPPAPDPAPLQLEACTADGFEAAASALTSLLRRVRSGPERAPRYTVLSDLSVRGFDADFARISNEGDVTVTAIVRSAARSLSRALYPRTRALLSRARRDAL